MTATLRNERGAVAVMSAFAMIVSLLAAALAVDIGRLAFETRRLQLVADMAALDGAQCLGGGTDPSLVVQNAARAGATRNNFLLTEPDNALGVLLGTVVVGMEDGVTGVRQFIGTAPQIADTVEVTATRAAVPLSLIAGVASFLPGLPGIPGSMVLSEVGVARGGPIVGLRAGSFLARVESEDSQVLNLLLGGLLGGSLSLDAVSYQGLVDSSVTLGDLAAAAGVGTVDELLALDLRFADFLRLVASAVGDDMASLVLNNIAAATVANVVLSVGDLLQVTTENQDAAALAMMNVFDLVFLGAQVAHGQGAITIDPFGVVILGVENLGLTLKIIEPPQIAVGPPGLDENGVPRTEVRTAQIRLQLRLRALTPVQGGVVNLDVAVQVAQTKAHVASVNCNTGDVTVSVTPGIASLHVGRFSPSIDAPSPTITPSAVLNVRLLGIPIAVTATAQVPIASNPKELLFNPPFPSDPQTVGTELGEALDSALQGLAHNLQLNTTIGAPVPPLLQAAFNALLNTTLNTLLGVLRPILSALDGLLEPLLRAFGVTLGGADVSVLSVTNSRQLVR